MYNSQNRIRNIELPENLFSNLGESKKSKKIISEENDIIKKYTEKYKENDLKLTNYSNRKEYRNRINNMYNNIKDMTPIDNEINDTLYFNNYIEKGIVVKPKVSSLKQFWTEYRLIKNEKKLPKYHLETEHLNVFDDKEKDNEEIHLEKTRENNEKDISKKLDDFDKLFEALSTRVEEINEYIDELKEMRINIDASNTKLQEDQEKLQKERKSFIDYKNEEEEKLQKEKESLKTNYDRLQTIIDDLDKKLNELDN